MNVGKTFYAKNRREWRGWLSKHHRTAPEIWLIFYKKQSGKPRIPYNHAVDEALCYGWIDSLLKPIDADRYAQRFSPRRPTDRKSTRLNSSHLVISYAVFCLKKKKHKQQSTIPQAIHRAHQARPTTAPALL